MKKNLGMTLLLSLLMLSMVLATSLGVSYLILTGIKLSEAVGQSELAYYAADSGVECALYVDIVSKKFGGGGKPQVQQDCSGVNPNDITDLGGWPNGARFIVNYPNGSCADVTVDKSGAGTIITSMGFNDCSAGASVKVNRSLVTQY